MRECTSTRPWPQLSVRRRQPAQAVDELEQRLKDGGFTLSFPTIRCKFKPTEATLQAMPATPCTP